MHLCSGDPRHRRPRLCQAARISADGTNERATSLEGRLCGWYHRSARSPQAIRKLTSETSSYDSLHLKLHSPRYHSVSMIARPGTVGLRVSANSAALRRNKGLANGPVTRLSETLHRLRRRSLPGLQNRRRVQDPFPLRPATSLYKVTTSKT